MNNRNYNIFFDLHTVSGIVICVGLYVIFFAGAFTLFEHAIGHWEKNETVVESHVKNDRPLDFIRLVESLKSEGYDLYGRNVYITQEGEKNQTVFLSGSEDKNATAEAKKEHRLLLNTDTYRFAKQAEGYSFGRLLYLLHFYYQLERPGYYLSGAVALFFLFAIVTGIVVHWEKLVSNFFLFRPLQKWKTVWTDAHTALGTIGLPFQLMYALTGAMFGLGILMGLSGSVLYEGNKDKVYEDLYGAHTDSLGPRKDMSAYPLNAYVDSAKARWKGYQPKYISLVRCESSTMEMSFYGSLDTKTKFLNSGEVVYDLSSGKVAHEHDPYNVPYSEAVWATVYRVHFADYGEQGTFGNYLIKILYFIMAIATGFVIITGVLIWLEARNKKHFPEKKKRYNQWVGHIYLAICLTMLPITAFGFIVSKLLPDSMLDHRKTIFNSVFFGGWLLLSLFFSLKRDNYFTNKWTLLSGAVLGLLIPIVNGIHTGNWFWRTFSLAHYDLFAIDALWLFLSLVCFYVVCRLKRPSAVDVHL